MNDSNLPILSEIEPISVSARPSPKHFGLGDRSIGPIWSILEREIFDFHDADTASEIRASNVIAFRNK